MKSLTKAEEQVMQILWKKEGAVVRDVLNDMPEPKPAYNTVSTIVRILEEKGFVDHKAYGKTYFYYPLVAKKEYSRNFFRHFFRNYFNGSPKRLMSFFSKEEDFNIQDLEEMRSILNDEISKRKNSEQ